MTIDRAGRRLAFGVVFLVLAAYQSSVASAVSATHTCHGKAATIVGTQGNDRLTGTAGPDIIASLGGDDVVWGLAGNDVVCGGAGLDHLIGGWGDDSLSGGRDTDWLAGSRGDDTLAGGQGEFSSLNGGPGNDTLRGGPDNSDIADYFSASRGVTVDLAGGTATGQGSDTLSEVEVVFGSLHDDVITGDDAPNTLVGRDGNDEISSGGGGNLECSNPQPGITFPFACADNLFGDAGDDTLIGGDGFDVANYFNAPPVTVDLSTGTATGEGNDALSTIEGVQGSTYDDTLIGDAGDNVFDPDQGNDVVTGGGGIDLVSFTDVASVSVNLAAGTASGAYLGGGGHWTYTLSGIENVWGTDGADTIEGDTGSNDVKGFGGDDAISGRDGNDDLEGGKGADRLYGDAGTDSLDGGSGDDTCLNGETVTSCESTTYQTQASGKPSSR